MMPCTRKEQKRLGAVQHISHPPDLESPLESVGLVSSMQRKAPSPGSRSTSTDSEVQAVATDTGIVSQAGSFSRKPPAAWSTSVAVSRAV